MGRRSASGFTPAARSPERRRRGSRRARQGPSGGGKADGTASACRSTWCVGAQTALRRCATATGRHARLGPNSYFGGGRTASTSDHRTGQRRRAVLQDVIEGAILQDALPEIDFLMSSVLPSDVDQRIYDRYQMEAMLNHSTKPIVFVSPDFQGCVAAVEMCEIIAGSASVPAQPSPPATSTSPGLIANQEATGVSTRPRMRCPCCGFDQRGRVNAWCGGRPGDALRGRFAGHRWPSWCEGTPVGTTGWNGGPYNR